MMNIRETFEKNKGLSIGLAIGLIVIAGLILFWDTRSGVPDNLAKSYYSVDDGKSYFADDLRKVYPFEHEGKQAVRAYVFKCKDGSDFVGYLERLTSAGQTRMQTLLAQPQDQSGSDIAAVMATETEVKRPGEAKWTPISSPAATAILSPHCPDGSTNFKSVFP